VRTILETQRLFLREINTSHDDLIQYLSWLQDTQSNSFIQSARVDYRLEELINFIEVTNSDDNALLLGLFLRKEDRFIGTLKVQPIDTYKGTAWLGIMIGSPEFRGQGYGREAIETVLNYLFDSLKIEKIFLGVDLENLSAIRLYRSLGFCEYRLDVGSMVMLKTHST
jgi:ribosomal-protein-alanine N-acetyltransferase